VSAAARELGSRVHAVKVDARCVGTARKVGAAALLDVMGLDPFAGASGWLATTDADSLVPPDWFVRQMGYRSGGADLVVGTVHVVDWQDRSRLRPHWERAYAADHHPRAPGHRHVHGANLSFSAAAYLRAGGFADVASDEDVRLVQACRSAGASVIWASDLSVATSARRIGRAPLGFAWYLNQLAHTVDGTLPNLELA
jgi:hypothetical protein